MKGIHFHFIRKIHARTVIISQTMIDDLINLAVALVKRAWFAYPLKENDEDFTQKEEEKEMKDPIEARDVMISNESNAQRQGHNLEQKKQSQQTLTSWILECNRFRFGFALIKDGKDFADFLVSSTEMSR